MKDLISLQTARYFIRLFLIGAAYAGIVFASLYLVPPGGSGASLVWPVAAFGMAALYFWGPGMWPALMLPFFALLLTRDISVPVAVGVALGNTLESVAGAYILQRFAFKPLLSRLADTLTLFFAAAVASTLAATVITSCLYFFGSTPGTFNVSLWTGLWIGHAVSIITLKV